MKGRWTKTGLTWEVRTCAATIHLSSIPTFFTSFMRTHARTKKVTQVSPRKTAVVMARLLVRDILNGSAFHNLFTSGAQTEVGDWGEVRSQVREALQFVYSAYTMRKHPVKHAVHGIGTLPGIVDGKVTMVNNALTRPRGE